MALVKPKKQISTEEIGFKQCPMLERCLKMAGFDCTDRYFVECDFLQGVLKAKFSSFKKVPDKYKKLYLVFWP